jgi:predicted ATPase/class 3 adenylate cyclase
MMPDLPNLPSGTVTFLFTDIEGSTQLLQRLGDAYARVLGEHQALLRAAFAAHGGVEVDTQGDAFFVAFPTAPAAVAAAAEATRALSEHAWPAGATLRVRMGLHTGAPQLVGDHYVGLDVHRAARIAAAGHGGQILMSDATRALVEQNLPNAASLRDLGPHQLKDLRHAERIHQLVLRDTPADFPALNTLDRHANNLPVQSMQLLGRKEELATICGLVGRDDARLVTLTGTGGVGKTRLALQVAAEVVEQFADGVWFIRLSRLNDPDLVIATIAQTLGIKDSGGQSVSDTLCEYLRARALLLVLDNFEQLVEASSAVAELLSECPGLMVLVTSRLPLHVRGEKVVPLAPLALAPTGEDRERLPPDQLAQYPAVALFLQRAQDAGAHFVMTAENAPVVAEICARLDGVPLAIELAATRVRVLPPEALLTRLTHQLSILTGGARDLEERQRTMRATIAWSEGLLRSEERELFHRLAIFNGGATLEAVEAVCLQPPNPDDVEPLELDALDGLGVLVDQSLVQQREEGGEPRFGMLGVIREYALERLETGGEADALRRAHATFFTALVERAAPELEGPRAGEWYDRLQQEHDNMRIALAWARERGEAEIGLRLAAAAVNYWFVRGYVSEGRDWLKTQLEAVSSGQVTRPPSIAVYARALSAAGSLAVWLLDVEQATTWLNEAITLARTIDDPRLLANTLNRLGNLAMAQGDLDTAWARFQESLEVASQANDEWASMRAQGNLAYSAYWRGDVAAAANFLREPLAYFRRLNSLENLGVSLSLSGSIMRRNGAITEALALLREALIVQRQVGNSQRMAEALYRLASAIGASGDGVRAARLIGAASTLSNRVGVQQNMLWRLDMEQSVASARSALGEEAWLEAEAAGRALSLEAAVAEALGEGSDDA